MQKATDRCFPLTSIFLSLSFSPSSSLKFINIFSIEERIYMCMCIDTDTWYRYSSAYNFSNSPDLAHILKFLSLFLNTYSAGVFSKHCLTRQQIHVFPTYDLSFSFCSYIVMVMWLSHLLGQKPVIASIPAARNLSRITLLSYFKT